MNIFITGDSRGLGYAIAEQLSKNHTVYGVSRKDIDVDWIHFTSDVSNISSIPDIGDVLRNCDVLINNAAVGYDGLLLIQPESLIDRLIEVNMSSPIKLIKKWSRARLGAKKSGIVLNISSICGIRGYAGLSVYSATKAGLNGLTRSLARELGGKNFRVNSILPGYMETDMSSGLPANKKKMIVRRTPLGRLATVHDIVPTIEFLISDKASFITGQTIVIDGGATT